MPIPQLEEAHLAPRPNRAVMIIGEGSLFDTRALAEVAVDNARKIMPKITGQLASTLQPVYGDGYFGLYFPDRVVYFLDRGTRPFTMRSLAGKTIPMWIDDPTGAERKANPKAKTRRTVDGRNQVLIFRRVGRKPNRKQAHQARIAKLLGRPAPKGSTARYPGQAGRIARREASAPDTTSGKLGGRVATGNVGVAWRHPGIGGRGFINYAMASVAIDYGLPVAQLCYVDDPAFYSLVRA